MNSSFSINSVTCLETLLNSVTQGRLRIVSLEFTEMREKGSATLYQVQMLLCAAEQKEKNSPTNDSNDVEKGTKDGLIV